MTLQNPFALSGQPSVVGTGLVALDVLIKPGTNSSESSFQYAGGTCGNVLAILAWLGWRSIPVARLDSDEAGSAVSSDMRKFGITMKFARMRPRAATPIIIERLRISPGGIPEHHFSLNCPTCGSWLPRYRPVTVRTANKVVLREKNPSVFFFDRASPGAIFLAKAYSEAGSLIVFEPSGHADEKLQKAALELAHICKYSREQFDGQPFGRGTKPLLEIQTMGGDGLRYRTSLADNNWDWRKIPAVTLDQMKDSAGAGDWLSAGLIFHVGQKGVAGFKASSSEELVDALRFGQALAAWNCQFEGARGGMYSVTKEQHQREVLRLMAGENVNKNLTAEVFSLQTRGFHCARATCRSQHR
jgi:fructokinase